MSEPKLISPMLDNFDMGGPISDHNGVRCCPAMRKNSDDKYIVKIISVPESQTKLDALLLTGAFSDNQSALAYFEELANGIVDEKKILDNLSQLEGFVAFEDCQIVPMDSAVGYDVYLISEYRKTLERSLKKAPMTQLAAVNLGLDLCSALSICRQSGYLFVDLKPSNIYIVGDKEYRIGDLGFLRLNSLKYESLPNKYRSCYTAPELEDVFAPLNDTMDIYSVGLILYQVFNGGVLPFSNQQVPGEKFSAPAYADAEMAEIILKACDPDPEKRWQDPVQMGQAIVSYMQKNGVNDTPLTAENFGPTVDIESASEEIDAITDTKSDELSVSPELEADVPTDSVEEMVETEIEETTEDAVLEAVEQLAANDEISDEVTVDDPQEDSVTSDEEEMVPVADEDISLIDETSSPQDESNQDENIQAEAEPVTDEYENLSFLDNLDDAEQILADVGSDYDGISDEISGILDQIDELTAHDVPAPVVAPEPVEIKMPEPIQVEDESSDVTDDEPGSSAEVEEISDESTSEEVETKQETVTEAEMPYVPKKKRTGLVWVIVIALLLAFVAGGYYFYTSYYLQPIHAITLEGSEDSLQVLLDTDVDETILTVICADSHGNKVSAPVVGGKAAFGGLTADTAYTISVEIDGIHKLTGVTSKVYSTPVQTKLVQMRAITGSESGSVILSFAVEGPDSEQWNIIYIADGEAERVTTFSGHMVTLTGLTVGKEYSFRLEPVSDIYISGETEITYIAKNLICAENLRITAFDSGMLTAQWDTPAGESVAQWSVRCYNENGYNETLATEENTVTFQNLNDDGAYTIEVTAHDMSVNQRVTVNANTVTVSDFAVNADDPDSLVLSWSANREIPADGWMIHYTVNDVTPAEPIATAENYAQVPVVPGCNFEFKITDVDGNEVLGGPFVYAHSGSSDFGAYGISKNEMTARLCKTPDVADWTYQDLSDEDYVNAFSAGEKISAVFACDGEIENADDTVLITYAVYNEDDILVNFAHFTQTWNDMWAENYSELDLSEVPVAAGKYNVVIYFNGAEAGSQKFEIIA